MVNYADDFKRCLEETDIVGIRRLWKHVQPNLPQPANDHDALVSLHMARTQSLSVRFELRAYSHRWLVDHGFPSLMPDNLKPRAERIYSKVVEAVGISVNFSSPLLKPIAEPVRKAMEDAVNDCYANGDRDPALIRQRMMEARGQVIKKLVGLPEK
jgi:hypothetical protein